MTAAPARVKCKGCSVEFADAPSEYGPACKRARWARHREDARLQAMRGELPTPEALARMRGPEDGELAALEAELDGEPWPTLGEALGEIVGAGLAGTELPGEVETCAQPGVNERVHRLEGSGPAPAPIPPPWEQDGPPYLCEACQEYSHDTMRAVNAHRRVAHGLRGEGAAAGARRRRAAQREVESPRMDQPPTINTADLLAKLTHQWQTLGILEVRFQPCADGRLAFQARLVDERFQLEQYVAETG